MNGKQFVIATLFALVLLTVVFIPTAQQQGGGTYDPWLDYNEDGKIDVNELNPLGQAYGTTGDPTKNVNVTNWPVERKLFPENLTLRVRYNYWAGTTQYDLIDATSAIITPYQIWKYEDLTTLLTSTPILFYNRTMIYQKIPLNAYQILGSPIVSLTYNVTNSPSTPQFWLQLKVYLGKISMQNEWTQLADLGSWYHAFSGQKTNVKNGDSFGPATPVTISINANERVAIRILVSGWRTSLPDTNLEFNMLFDENTNNCIVCIPIAS